MNTASASSGLWRLIATSLLAGLLAACASPAFEKPGASRADVVARVGAPTRTAPLEGGGERLLYSAQPAGRTVYHLDFDANARLVRVDQVLTLARLQAIPVNHWSVVDVQREFGPPAIVERVATFDGDVWTYRFLDDFNNPRFAHIHIDRSGVVRQLLFTDELPRGDDARN
jgi:hypothetical protein